MSVCWKPGWCECPACGPLTTGFVGDGAQPSCRLRPRHMSVTQEVAKMTCPECLRVLAALLKEARQ